MDADGGAEFQFVGIGGLLGGWNEISGGGIPKPEFQRGAALCFDERGQNVESFGDAKQLLVVGGVIIECVENVCGGFRGRGRADLCFDEFGKDMEGDGGASGLLGWFGVLGGWDETGGSRLGVWGRHDLYVGGFRRALGSNGRADKSMGRGGQFGGRDETGGGGFWFRGQDGVRFGGWRGDMEGDGRADQPMGGGGVLGGWNGGGGGGFGIWGWTDLLVNQFGNDVGAFHNSGAVDSGHALERWKQTGGGEGARRRLCLGGKPGVVGVGWEREVGPVLAKDRGRRGFWAASKL